MDDILNELEEGSDDDGETLTAAEVLEKLEEASEHFPRFLFCFEVFGTLGTGFVYRI